MRVCIDSQVHIRVDRPPRALRVFVTVDRARRRRKCDNVTVRLELVSCLTEIVDFRVYRDFSLHNVKSALIFVFHINKS